MRVLQTAGPRQQLRLVRQTTAETGTSAQRYAVRLCSREVDVVLFTGRRFADARLKFLEEADWRRYELQPFAGRQRQAVTA